MLVAGQPACWTVRIQAGPPQDLVDEEVAQPGDPGLVEEPGLERCERRPERGAELRDGERRRVRTEPADVGVEFERTEPSGITDAELPSIEVDDETVPGGLVASPAVLEPVDRVRRRRRGAARSSRSEAQSVGPSVSTSSSLPIRSTPRTRRPLTAARTCETLTP